MQHGTCPVCRRALEYDSSTRNSIPRELDFSTAMSTSETLNEESNRLAAINEGTDGTESINRNHQSLFGFLHPSNHLQDDHRPLSESLIRESRWREHFARNQRTPNSNISTSYLPSRPILPHVRVRVEVDDSSEIPDSPAWRAGNPFNPFNVFGVSAFSGTSSRSLSSTTIMTPRQAAPATASNEATASPFSSSFFCYHNCHTMQQGTCPACCRTSDAHEHEASHRQSTEASYSGRNQETDENKFLSAMRNEILVGDRNSQSRYDPCVDHLLPASTNSRTATQLLQHSNLSEQRGPFNFFFQEHELSNAAAASTAYTANVAHAVTTATHSNTSSYFCLGTSTSAAVATTSHANSHGTKFKLNPNAREFVPRSRHVQPHTTSIGPFSLLTSLGMHANGNRSLISQHENNVTSTRLTPAASALGVVFQDASPSTTVNPQCPLGSTIFAPVVPNVGPLATTIAPPQITCITPLNDLQMNTNMPNSSLLLFGGSITGMRLPNNQILAPVVPNVGPLSTTIAPNSHRQPSTTSDNHRQQPQITCMTPLIDPQMNTNMPNSSLLLLGGSITGMRLPNSQISGMTYPLINMLPPEPPLPDSSTTHTSNFFPLSGRLNSTESFHAVTSRR